MEMRFFEVGGCVRDGILGTPTKDIDFAVEMANFSFQPFLADANPAFAALGKELTRRGFTIFQERPEFFTFRARFPKGDKNEKLVADFVLCREDGPSTDGRRPDWVTVGTLLNDLARRDFTMNAMARDEKGSLIDPFGGERDLNNRQIRFVGNPTDRIREDALRVLRALRFVITKNMVLEQATFEAIRDPSVVPLLGSISKERMRDELDRMFHADTIRSFDLLAAMPEDFRQAIFDNGLRLKPTMEA